MKRIYKTTALAVITVLSIGLTGCKSTNSKPVAISKNISLPALNTPAEVYLGESMLMQAIGLKSKFLSINSEASFYGRKYVQTDIPLVSINQDGSKVFKCWNNNYGVYELNGYGNESSKFCKVTVKENSDGSMEICSGVLVDMCHTNSEVSFQVSNKEKLFLKKGAFQQSIEYNGKTGDILKFTYREFQNNMSRGNFTTDFTIDLTEGKTLRYKGATIEVMEASNQSIKYKVLQNFS